MAEEYEEVLKANLRKLGELGARPEEVSITDRIFERLAEQELALHRLTNICRDFVSSRELGELRAGLEQRIDKVEASGWARISELRYSLEGLEAKLKELVARPELENTLNTIKSTRSELESKLEQARSEFNAVTKRLSEVDAEIIADLGKLDRISERLELQELELKKLSELTQGFVTQRALEELRSQISREDLVPLKSLLDTTRSQMSESVSKLESMFKEGLAKLSQVDSGIMDRISKLEQQALKLSEHDLALKKLGEIYEGFLDRKALDAFREEILNQHLKQARSELESKLGTSYADLSKRMDSLERSLAELAKRLEQLPQIDALRAEFSSRLSSFERGIKEGIRTVAEVDSRIIEDLGALRSSIQRLPELELKLKRLSEIYEGFATKRDLSELRSGLESRLTGIPAELSTKLAGMEAKLEELWDRTKIKSIPELESKIDELGELIGKLRRDFDSGIISREIFEASRKRLSEQLEQIRSQLEQRKLLDELKELVKKHEQQLSKLLPSG